MSEDSFKKFMNKCRDTAKTVALATAVVLSNEVSAAPKMPENDKESDKNKIEKFEKTENTTLETEIAYDFNGTQIEIKGDTLVVDDVKHCISDLQNQDEAMAKFLEKQKEAYDNAPNDTIIVKTFDDWARENICGSFSGRDKNVTIYDVEQVDTTKVYKLALSKKIDKEKAARVDKIKGEIPYVQAHENQHRINDKGGGKAPGINPEQRGKLDCWNEVSANVAELVLLNNEYQSKLSEGMSKDEALKVFDKNKRFSFYKEAIYEGLNPESDEAKKLMVQGTTKMWKDKYLNGYDEQIKSSISYDERYNDNTIASTLIGDEVEYKKRVEKMFDSIDENPILKEKGIKIGNLSQYLPKEDFELTPEQKQLADTVTKNKTGFSAEDGLTIKKDLSGNDKQDQKDFTEKLKNPQEMGRYIMELSGRIKPTSNNTASNQGQVKTQTQANTNVNVAQLAAQRTQGR